MLTLGMEMGNLKKIGIFPHKYESFPQPSDTCLLNTLAQLGNSSYPKKQAGRSVSAAAPAPRHPHALGSRTKAPCRPSPRPLCLPSAHSKTSCHASVRWGRSQCSGSAGMPSVPRCPCTLKPPRHQPQVRGKAAPPHNYC